ncbi:MAG: hypothetical protein ACYC3B_03805 [Sedimentisphaerales bacterium]
MKTRDFFKYAARPFNIFILLCVLTFIISFWEMISAVILKSLTPPVSLPESETMRWNIHCSRKEFTPDGKALLAAGAGNGNVIWDTNCVKLWEGRKNDLPIEYKYLEWTEALEHNPDFKHSGFILQASEAFIIMRNKEAKETWKYLPDSEIFAGYKFEGGIIGYLGINGFSQTQTDIKPFGKPKGDSNTIDILKNQEKYILLWQTEKQFFAIDFKNRKAEIIIDGGENNISDIETKNWNYDGQEPIDANYRTIVKYSTENGIINLLLNQPNEKITVKTPQQWNNYLPNKVKVTATKDVIFLYHWTTDTLKPADYDTSHKVRHEFNTTGRPVSCSAELYKVDSAGNLSPVNEFRWAKPEYVAPVYKDEKYYLGYTSVVSPPIFYGGNKIIENLPKSIEEIFPNDKEGLVRGYADLITTFYPRNLTASIALSVVMMLLTLWHGWSRKNNRLSLALWVILVGLFNVAGLLTYLALNHTTLIKCPACGKNRNLEMPACIHCQAELPLPPASMVRIK